MPGQDDRRVTDRRARVLQMIVDSVRDSSWTAADLGRATALPEGAVRRVLNILLARGLVRCDDSGEYVAAPPLCIPAPIQPCDPL
jgi:DNA-binding IclR family transcriptional regulator